MPNQISLAKYDKKDWIFRNARYNRYKIANVKKFNPKIKTGGRSGRAVFAYDGGDRLTFTRISYGVVLNGGKANFSVTQRMPIYRFKIKDGHLIAWKLVPQTVSTAPREPRAVRNFSNNIGQIKTDIFNLGAKAKVHPAYVKRLNNVIVNFLKRNNIIFKYSKDPFENLRIGCYPHSAGISLRTQAMSSLYSKHFLHGDIKYVVKKCFGFDNRNLVKMVCKSIADRQDCEILRIGIAFKGLMPVDYFYKLIEKGMKATYMRMGPKNSGLNLSHMRHLFKQYNSARLLKLAEADDFDTYNFYDSVRIFEQRKTEPEFKIIQKPKNWTEVHDFLAPPHRAGAAANLRPYTALPEAYDLPVKPEYKEIDGVTIDDLRLEIPKHTDDLARYSNLMSNCVRWYGSQVKNNQCDIVGVYRGTNLLYNISIRNKAMDQFYGHANSLPPEADRNKVVEFLKAKQLVIRDVAARPILGELNQNIIRPAGDNLGQMQRAFDEIFQEI